MSSRTYVVPHSDTQSNRKAVIMAARSWRQTSSTSESNESILSPPKSPNPTTQGNWRERSNSPPKSKGPRFDKIRLGEAFYLPKKEYIDQRSIVHESVKRQWDGGDGVYNHPVVVIDKCPENQRVIFLTCTSFSKNVRDNGINDTKKSESSRKAQLLCDNDDNSVQPHLSTQKLLIEPGSEKFEKASYINLRGLKFEIEAGELQRHKRRIVLSVESIARLHQEWEGPVQSPKSRPMGTPLTSGSEVPRSNLSLPDGR